MPLSAVDTGFGTALHINLGAGLVEVAEILEVSDLPSGQRELYETTHMKSVGFKEWKKQPLKDGVEITLRGNYVIGSASDALLQAADDAEVALAYKIVTPQNADVFQFTGTALFYGYKRMNPMDDRRTFEITMKPVDQSVQAQV